FLGREIQRHKDYSEKTAEEIDAEIKRIVIEGYDRAEKILQEDRAALEAIAEALMERESINGDEVGLLIRGEKLPPMPLKPEPKDGAEEERSEENSEAPAKSPVPGKIPPVPPSEQPA
ncbi:MAG: cell division protein FtsH, partial [Nitrospinota bacterium]|nr:cell division protein FtsH [Nitrospinota bacterium]